MLNRGDPRFRALKKALGLSTKALRQKLAAGDVQVVDEGPAFADESEKRTARKEAVKAIMQQLGVSKKVAKAMLRVDRTLNRLAKVVDRREQAGATNAVGEGRVTPAEPQFYRTLRGELVRLTKAAPSASADVIPERLPWR